MATNKLNFKRVKEKNILVRNIWNHSVSPLIWKRKVQSHLRCRYCYITKLLETPKEKTLISADRKEKLSNSPWLRVDKVDWKGTLILWISRYDEKLGNHVMGSIDRKTGEPLAHAGTRMFIFSQSSHEITCQNVSNIQVKLINPHNVPFLSTTMSSTQSSEMVALLVKRMRGRDDIDDRWVQWPCNYYQKVPKLALRSLEARQTFQGIARWILLCAISRALLCISMVLCVQDGRVKTQTSTFLSLN